jgi:hypothetical protein
MYAKETTMIHAEEEGTKHCSVRFAFWPTMFFWVCCGVCKAQGGAETLAVQGGTSVPHDTAEQAPAVKGFNPEDQSPLLRTDGFMSWPAKHSVHVFGWVDGGITTVSNASGLVVEAPTTNRFSNQVILNAAWIVVERKTTKSLSWGFRSDFYAGSDAALLRSLDHFGPGGPRFGTEVREAYAMVHTPGIFGRDIDWSAGRINYPTGAETVFGSYQKLYSRGYYWIHAETSGTGLFATTHVSPQVDVIAGTTMGYNTSFILRGRAPDYLLSTVFHPATQRKQQLSATVYSGPRPIAATATHAGNWQTLAELQAREAWSGRFSQVYQVSYITDTRDPGNRNHTSQTHGAMVLSSYELSRTIALNTRLEYFADPRGTRIGIPGTYGEATAGVAFHPKTWMEFRPEVRGDFSGQQSFGPADSSQRHRNEFSSGFELLFKGKLF